jgi:hypothetical protein
MSVDFLSGGQILASKAGDGDVRIWECGSWSTVAAIKQEIAPRMWAPGLAFHPSKHRLATLAERDSIVQILELDVASLIGASTTANTIRYTSAKIVLVGESNVGKSCLAMRLAMGRYPEDHEHGTTHGMRFWKMKPEQLDPQAAAPEGERREVVIWDMGGQDEYRLIHQLFLSETTIALILLDPTRGRAAMAEAELWNKRFEKQVFGRKIS